MASLEERLTALRQQQETLQKEIAELEAEREKKIEGIEGLSLTWNVRTGDGTRLPTLDVTITLQTILKVTDEEEVIKVETKLINSWFQEKFEHILQASLGKPIDKGRTVTHPLTGMDTGLVRFSPFTYQITEEELGQYHYYWTWFRTKALSSPRNEHDEGVRKKWNEIPTVTEWSTSRRGKKPTTLGEEAGV